MFSGLFNGDVDKKLPGKTIKTLAQIDAFDSIDGKQIATVAPDTVLGLCKQAVLQVDKFFFGDDQWWLCIAGSDGDIWVKYDAATTVNVDGTVVQTDKTFGAKEAIADSVGGIFGFFKNLSTTVQWLLIIAVVAVLAILIFYLYKTLIKK